MTVIAACDCGHVGEADLIVIASRKSCLAPEKGPSYGKKPSSLLETAGETWIFSVFCNIRKHQSNTIQDSQSVPLQQKDTPNKTGIPSERLLCHRSKCFFPSKPPSLRGLDLHGERQVPRALCALRSGRFRFGT